jgi:hypothetical protein
MDGFIYYKKNVSKMKCGVNKDWRAWIGKEGIDEAVKIIFVRWKEFEKKKLL